MSSSGCRSNILHFFFLFHANLSMCYFSKPLLNHTHMYRHWCAHVFESCLSICTWKMRFFWRCTLLLLMLGWVMMVGDWLYIFWFVFHQMTFTLTYVPHSHKSQVICCVHFHTIFTSSSGASSTILLDCWWPYSFTFFSTMTFWISWSEALGAQFLFLTFNKSYGWTQGINHIASCFRSCFRTEMIFCQDGWLSKKTAFYRLTIIYRSAVVMTL